MSRAFNFSAGPAAMPTEVLERAQAEMLDYRGTGMSVMEMSHRSSEFIEIAERAEADFRELLSVSDDYAVLFLQGGATLQFSMVPLNLLGDSASADYLDTGSWSAKAIKEARRLCEVNVVASSLDHIPNPDEWSTDPQAAYLHICSNETIGGVQFQDFPSADVPLVADMSSDILSRPVDVSRFAVIYAWCARICLVVRGPARPACSTTRCMPKPAPCPTRRPPIPGTWRAWYSNGSRIRVALPRWNTPTGARLLNCTA